MSVSDSDKNVPCDFEAELPLLLYQGELEREERERLRSHLATCARCEEAFSQLETTAIALDGALAVPKPSPEQWRKLKENVLARVAGPPPAEVPSHDEPCESVEEDLLVLNELGVDRKKAVLAHVDKCASCRDTRSAFGSIGIVLNRQPLEWPAIERWDSLKESVFATIQAEVKKEPQKKAPPVAPAPVSRGPFVKVAVAAVLLVAVVGSGMLLRGPTPEDVRRHWHEAQEAGTLAQVQRSYEQVLQKGVSMPECRFEVNDALAQLQAIYRFKDAYEQPEQGMKRIQLLELIVAHPNSRVIELALDEYKKLTPAANERAILVQLPRFKAEPGRLEIPIDPTMIHRYTENLESEYAKLDQIWNENDRKRREAELRGLLATSHIQWAQSERANRDVAISHYKKALEYSEPNSPAALDARKHLRTLTGH